MATRRNFKRKLKLESLIPSNYPNPESRKNYIMVPNRVPELFFAVVSAQKYVRVHTHPLHPRNPINTRSALGLCLNVNLRLDAICLNNRTSLFLDLAHTYGIPSRLRGDRGVENIKVISWMEEHCDVCQGSYVWGQSVYNVRIERLWVDVTAQVRVHISIFSGYATVWTSTMQTISGFGLDRAPCDRRLSTCVLESVWGPDARVLTDGLKGMCSRERQWAYTQICATVPVSPVSANLSSHPQAHFLWGPHNEHIPKVALQKILEIQIIVAKMVGKFSFSLQDSDSMWPRTATGLKLVDFNDKIANPLCVTRLL
ncbi:hypothetical protein C8J57DRAFT_1240214 [Mycena rebaudengoi]|nr:hypothetical protein C8J57DRAFT_1240214 [Mycena rebaudengoi]